MILPSIRVIVRLAKNSPKNQSRIPEPTNVYGSGKCGQRSASRYQSQADNRFTDSQTAGNTSGSIDK